jgi:hypothetical protein
MHAESPKSLCENYGADRSCWSRLCFQLWGFIEINRVATSRSGPNRLMLKCQQIIWRKRWLRFCFGRWGGCGFVSQLLKFFEVFIGAVVEARQGAFVANEEGQGVGLLLEDESQAA